MISGVLDPHRREDPRKPLHVQGHARGAVDRTAHRPHRRRAVLMCAAAVGEKPTQSGIEKSMTAKAALSKALADSSAYCNKVIDGMTDQKGMEIVKFFTGDTPRLMVLDVQHRPQLRALRQPGHLHAPEQDRAAVEREVGDGLAAGLGARGSGPGRHDGMPTVPRRLARVTLALAAAAVVLAGLRARLLAGRAALLRQGAQPAVGAAGRRPTTRRRPTIPSGSSTSTCPAAATSRPWSSCTAAAGRGAIAPQSFGGADIYRNIGRFLAVAGHRRRGHRLPPGLDRGLARPARRRRAGGRLGAGRTSPSAAAAPIGCS